MPRGRRLAGSVDVSDSPALLRLAEQVRISGHPRALRAANREVGVLIPPRQARRRAARRAAPRGSYLRPEDTLWNLVGIGASEDGSADVSENKHRFLAEAYLPKAP